MWVTTKLLDLFKISKDIVDHQREDLAVVRAERDLLKGQLQVAQDSFKWITIRVNALELERSQLFLKVYNLNVPAPEIIRNQQNPIEYPSNLFDHIDDEEAKKIGLPLWRDN